MGGSSNVMPVISKIYCSSSPTTLTVRKRPHVINGGGFVVMNASHGAVFVVEGCGILGVKGELALKDGDGGLILSISKRVASLGLLGLVSLDVDVVLSVTGRNRPSSEHPPQMERVLDGLRGKEEVGVQLDGSQVPDEQRHQDPS